MQRHDCVGIEAGPYDAVHRRQAKRPQRAVCFDSMVAGACYRSKQ
jgi:hypothetical protein